MKRIIIVGGGYAGLAAAKHLGHTYKRNKDIEILLIDKNPYHTLMTELHEVAGARVPPEAVKVHFDKIFAVSKVKYVRDLIKKVDFKSRKINGVMSEYEYDYLILGTGVEPSFFNLPGVREHSFPLWSYDDAMDIREHTDKMFRLALGERDQVKRKEYLTFVIVGAGFTGMEMAGELMERKRKLCRRYGIDPNEVKIIIVEALADVLPMLPEKQRQIAIKYYKKKNIAIKTRSRCVKATEKTLELHTGEIIATRMIIWTCGVMGTDFSASLDVNTSHIRRPQPNRFMQCEKHPEVYFAGDMIWFMEDEKPLPQIVETALQTGKTAAENIIRAMSGKPCREHKTNYHGVMVSLGSRYGLSWNKGIAMRGFFALVLKHLVNFHYLSGVAGLNAVWGYLKHEFLDLEDKRSILGGHASGKVPVYWILLARLWLGLMWLVEGVNKISEGWLRFSSGSKSGWMFSNGVSQAGHKIADTASAASAAGEAAPAASQAVSDAVSAASGNGYSAAENAASAVSAASDTLQSAAQSATWTGDAGVTLGPLFNLDKPVLNPDSALVTWFRTTFMDGIFAHVNFAVFQTLVVFTEIAIGLAIMGGLLTFPAAIVSIGLCLVFTLSGMFSWSQLWFVFLAIAMLGGAGKAFGLDYWVMPRLKRIWNGTRFAKKTYLYIGYPDNRKKRRAAKKA
ncbi:MAG: NAD(P)/FAD-dependent oxidoreductase [Spirochaetales bacterium]|nr:NAD(P)/FAD-dependent oxidoreductase [Spirochaetales bacterium]